MRPVASASWGLKLGLGLAIALVGASTSAQSVYKIVGADGKITFSDKPPVSADKSTNTATTATGSYSAGNADLPYELRQVATKYPVTLYTTTPCAPCDAGRALLKSRGVPFTEKTVTTAEDQDSLQRLAGEVSLPFATLGGQQLKGYSDGVWSQYLDAAGYPKTSALPKSYRYPSPSPLVAVQKPSSPKAEAARTPPEVAPSIAAPSPSNPAGITF